VVFVFCLSHAQLCSFCLYAGLPCCPDDRAPRRHIHSIPLHYVKIFYCGGNSSNNGNNGDSDNNGDCATIAAVATMAIVAMMATVR
jgi:hypothetical protein